jgi:DNA-binding transcriptional MerR regulator
MRTKILTVSELAHCSAVTVEAIRHYTDKGLLQPKRENANGYRIYQLADVGRVRFIRQAKLLGFTLNEIDRILSHADKGRSPCSDVRDMIRDKITSNRRRLDELEKLQMNMEHALDQWRAMPDKAPDGDSICHLIESVVKGMDTT